MTNRELMQIALLSLVGSKTINNKETQEAINLLLDKLAQPEREWVGLTEEEVFSCQGRDYFETYKFIEAKLKEKNT